MKAKMGMGLFSYDIDNNWPLYMLLSLPTAFMIPFTVPTLLCLRVTYEEMETQGGSVTCPKSQNQFSRGVGHVSWLLA